MAKDIPQNIYDLIKSEEGIFDTVQADGKGFSGGRGHQLSEAELRKYPVGTPIPLAKADEWYAEDLEKSYRAAQAQANSLSRFHELDATQREDFLERLTSVNFQLGTSWNREHTDTWKLMQAGDFEGASVEALDSKWAKEDTPTRAKKFSNVLASLGSTTGEVYGGYAPGTRPTESFIPPSGPLFSMVTGQPRTRTRTLRQLSRAHRIPVFFLR